MHLHRVVSEVPRRVVSYIDLGIFDSKNKTRRTVPVSAKLKEVLKRGLNGLDPEDHIFTYIGRGGRNRLSLRRCATFARVLILCMVTHL